MVSSKKKINGLKYGIDCRLWNESGIGRYTRNLVFQLAKKDSENFYYLFLLHKNLDLKLPANFIKVEAEIGWYGVAEQIKMPKLLNSYNLDLVHFPHFNVPYLYRGKFIVTIHDLIHQHFAMKRATRLNPISYRVKQLGYSQIFRHAIYSAQKIITPSQFVKNQLEDEWNIEPADVVVTPEGVEEDLINLVKRNSQSDWNILSKKFQISQPYLFYLGNAHPHKNIEKLIEVFSLLSKKYPKLQMVLSGPDHYFWQRIQKEFKADKLIYTGFVSDQELVTLYRNAQALVIPSLEEGFGIPLLEAMACGCPVVCSRVASLPEVGGDACLYFEPKSNEDMFKQISKIIDDSKLRNDLIKKGKSRYQQFSWEKMAEQTLKIYQE